MMNQENIFDKQRRAIYYELVQIGLEQQECWAEANLTLEHVTGIKRTQQVISDLDNFKADWVHEITRIINSRRHHMPLAYCLGEIEFAGLMFKIIPGVLIPRVDTETLVETIIARFSCRDGLHLPASRHPALESKAPVDPSMNVTRDMDVPKDIVGADCIRPLHRFVTAKEHLVSAYIAEIGVGCGAIAISLLKRLPECTVWGCDTSETAIATTLGNARRHNVHERLTLVHGDWKKVLPGNFDVIVSNPPYLPLSLQADRHSKLQPELAFEPKSALFDGSEDGLSFYRQFAEKLPAHFARYALTAAKRHVGVDCIDPANIAGECNPPLQGGITPFAAFEIGDKQEQAVLDIFKQSGWQNVCVIHDTNDIARVLRASPPDINS